MSEITMARATLIAIAVLCCACPLDALAPQPTSRPVVNSKTPTSKPVQAKEEGLRLVDRFGPSKNVFDTAQITALAESADGALLAWGDINGTICLYSFKTKL